VTAATVKRLDPTSVELEIAISNEELEAARDRAFRDLVRNVRIPGFRPGKAPRKVFENAYGAEIISERAMEAVVPDAYSRALREHDLEPVEQPQMEMLPKEADGDPIRLRATVSVRPEIVLGAYKGLELESPPITVTDEDVAATLAALRKDSGTLVPVDRPVAFGDTPTLDYEGKIDGVPFEGGTATGAPTEMLADRFIPGFGDGIVGMSAGETKDVEARFPDDYGNAELAGKTAVFTVRVLENKATELPEVDDEFAQRFGETVTAASLPELIRERLRGQRQMSARRALSGPLVEKLRAMHEVALPAVMVDREAAHLFDEAKGYVERAGIAWPTYLEEQKKSEDELRAEYRTEAEQRVKTTLLLEAIAKAENISADDADIEAEIASLGRQYGQPREAILEMLRPNFGALVDGIVRTKTLEFLLDNAKITEVAPAATPALAESNP
jgi:trigger factor